MKKLKLDIMLPVYYKNLPEIMPALEQLVPFFERKLSFVDWKIVLSINGKNPQDLLKLAKKLNKQNKKITLDYVQTPGKGSGIIHSWLKSKADIVSYMDIDLSADIKSFPLLIKQVLKGYDIAIGSRNLPESHVQRSLKRKAISLAYHKVFMRVVLGAKDYTDAQCGFKAATKKSMQELLPLVQNKNWFFESELLYLAQKNGYKIKEIPVHWIESKFSGIVLYKTIAEFIVSSMELRFRKH